MEIDPCAKYDTPVSCKQKLWVGHEEMSKPYKFDLEVKDQRRIGIVNVCDTSSHSDTPMSQIWYAYAEQESAQTDGQTEQTYRVIPMYPPFIARRSIQTNNFKNYAIQYWLVTIKFNYLII